jgi:hypothetical protein
MDVLVYAPAGVLLTAASDLPAMAEKGRRRIERELHNAHVVGRFVVDAGLRQMRGQFERLAGQQPSAPDEPAPAAGHRTGVTPGGTNGRAGGRATGPQTVRSKATTSAAASRDAASSRVAAVDRAIPDYDTLSASQVVRRLDGLTASELRAVVRHELANRGRRTVLHRTEQLLGQAPAAPPTSPPPPATG